ncbi:MAG TPA: selenide, water dikinase SelD [Bacteroides sp.]|nr:selenide, water dikinase SelD [Bacteroides sp.]
MQPVYLDYNATTPLDREVIAAMQPFLSGVYGNPSSAHTFGFEARKAVEDARVKVAGLMSCRPEEVVFTSGGTESNNYAIKGIAKGFKSKGRHIITSAIEHPATLEACRYLESEGYDISYIPVDRTGIILLSELEKTIRKDTILITVMHANNEIGTIQPLWEISRIAKKHNIPFHADAAQSAGKIPVNVKELGVDMLSLAGHKFYGPKGIGALYVRDGLKLDKLIHGADHESNRRAGTENVLLIAGFGKACEVAERDLDRNSIAMLEMRDALFMQISKEIPGVVRNGDPENCLPNTLSISFPGVEANLLLAAMPEIAGSAGAACHAEHTEISHVIRAIGLEEEVAMGTIRLSTGKMTSREEIDEAARQIISSAKSLVFSESMVTPTDGPDEDIRLTRFTQGLGCACKMSPQDLEAVLKNLPVPDHENILVDSRHSDDATIWKVDSETAWVQSVDFFTPIVDNPFSFGRIAAANALSDIYAMGAEPLFALNIVAFPTHRLPLDVLHQILAGAQSIADEAGIFITGGHTIEDSELKYGMVVNGRIHPEKILRNSEAKPGDAIVLTKPIGTGILATALKRMSLQSNWLDPLLDTMMQLNKLPVELFSEFQVHALTDVTGFGLLGHLLEMARSSRVSARVFAQEVPVLDGVYESIKAGMVPGGSRQNLDYINEHARWGADITDDKKIILSDAQTSGGLLISLPVNLADKFLDRLIKAGFHHAAIIGEIGSKTDSELIID